MLKKLLPVLLLLFGVQFFTACQAPSGESEVVTAPEEVGPLEERVIYGADGRLDLYQVRSSLQKRLADSTVALVKGSSIQTGATSSRIFAETFRQSYNLCSSEKFGEQENAAFCSGSLVAPDVIATAGHCVRSLRDCSEVKFVFGYAVKAAGVLPREVKNGEIYSCKQIIHTEVLASGSDFALVRLDRAVSNHAPLAVRRSGSVKVGDGLVVIGHPVGLPTKVTVGGKVRSTQPAQHFVAHLDTYGGNSGSAVFNSRSGVIEGILVRGENDFVTQGGCVVSKRCQEGECRGEDVTRISEILPYL